MTAWSRLLNWKKSVVLFLGLGLVVVLLSSVESQSTLIIAHGQLGFLKRDTAGPIRNSEAVVTVSRGGILGTSVYTIHTSTNSLLDSGRVRDIVRLESGRSVPLTSYVIYARKNVERPMEYVVVPGHLIDVGVVRQYGPYRFYDIDAVPTVLSGSLYGR